VDFCQQRADVTRVVLKGGHDNIKCYYLCTKTLEKVIRFPLELIQNHHTEMRNFWMRSGTVAKSGLSCGGKAGMVARL
jgi:hypothetical protein